MLIRLGLHGLWTLQESAGPVVTAPGQERFTADFRSDAGTLRFRR